ncbi:MAG: chorismate synthase [Clostridia bacterium]|nr:chorismate synthase [Clostridia bacterium]
MSFKVEIYGGSHEKCVGAKIKGLPLGTKVNMDSIRAMLKRRGASQSPWSTPRIERDEVTFVSGVTDGVVTGDIIAEIQNLNTKPQDYSNLNTIPRPSHADYVSYVKYGRIFSGGGKWSARLTAPLCVVGAIIKDALKEQGIEVGAYVSSIGKVQGKSYKNGVVTLSEIEACHKEALPTLANAEQMVEEVLSAKKELDSVGGSIECIVYGLPVGLGDNLMDGMESEIAFNLYGIPGVKGVEFGSGFDLTEMRGSFANDPFAVVGGKVQTLTNHAGGINGGITNGMPLTLRVAMRPTPSIAKEQDSVDLLTLTPTRLSVKGRHDSCIVPRAVAVVECAVAIAIYQKLLENQSKD